jgi:aquaporin Z
VRKYVTEFIGTSGLVFTVGCVVMGKAALAPLAIGAALMVFVYVALGASVMGLLSWSNVWIYLLADFAGGAAAALAFRYLNPDDLEGGDAHLHLSHAFRPSSE